MRMLWPSFHGRGLDPLLVEGCSKHYTCHLLSVYHHGSAVRFASLLLGHRDNAEAYHPVYTQAKQLVAWQGPEDLQGS